MCKDPEVRNDPRVVLSLSLLQSAVRRMSQKELRQPLRLQGRR